MSDPKPNIEGPPPTGSPIVNETRLEATNSQIGNTAQVVNSPGAVVNQAVTQAQAGTNSAAIILGGFALLTAQAFLPTSRSYEGVNSFVAGGALAMIVFGFFSWVECLLKPAVRFEIAGWLVGVKVGQKLEPWPETFAKVFDRVLGRRHLSWTCFWRISLACVILYLPISAIYCFGLREVLFANHLGSFGQWTFLILLAGLPTLGYDYVSLLETRLMMRVLSNIRNTYATASLLLLDLVFSLWLGLLVSSTVYLAVLTTALRSSILQNINVEGHYSALSSLIRFLPFAMRTAVTSPSLGKEEVEHLLTIPHLYLWMIPALLTSIWLWLYAGSGFLLRLARRFDVGFQWFNRRFDIEKHPMSCIGIVSGSVVALIYWAAVIVSRVVQK